MKLPMKSALLMEFINDGEQWDYEAIDKIVKEYNSDTMYYRLVLRFGLMELAGGMLLEVTQEAIDDGSHFKADSVVCKYKVTDFGRDRSKVLE